VVSLAKLWIRIDPVLERGLAALLGIARRVQRARLVLREVRRSKVRLELVGVDRVRQDDREIAVRLATRPVVRGQRTSARRMGPYVRNASVRAELVPRGPRRAALVENEIDRAVERERRDGHEHDVRFASGSGRRMRSADGDRFPLRIGLRPRDQPRRVLDLRWLHGHVEFDLEGGVGRTSTAPSVGASGRRWAEPSRTRSDSRPRGPHVERPRPAPMVTAKRVEPGSGRSGAKSRPWVPTQRQPPATGWPSSVKTRAAGNESVSAPFGS